MDKQTDERDLQLLEKDKYTFAVISRILKHPCRFIQTDQRRLIICHSADPYPVWIWTPDHLSPEEKEAAWNAVTQACPIAEGYRYNLKQDLASFFLSKAKEQGTDLAVLVNLFAYDCPNPMAPSVRADGHIHPCTPGDLEEAAEITKRFHRETATGPNSEEVKNQVKERIQSSQFFFWKDRFNRTVASCYYVPNGALASVSGVYTLPEYRRKHYAENLVYQVTKVIEASGAMPMLYTDADYVASNRCYEKIGYVLRGKLCTIGSSDVEG